MKQRVSRQPDWSPLPAWYLSLAVFLVLLDPASMGLGLLVPHEGRARCFQKLRFRLGFLDLSQLGGGRGGQGEMQFTCAWLSQGLTSHTATLRGVDTCPWTSWRME